MGNQRLFLQEGGFSQFLYHQVGETFVAPNGVEGEVIEKIDGTAFDGLPAFSKTAEVYLKADADGNIIQARIYKDRMPICDFDWGHPHKNKNGDVFPDGVVHVQLWQVDSKGHYFRDSKHARYMSNDEMKRYGPLINMVNANAKFRR